MKLDKQTVYLPEKSKNRASVHIVVWNTGKLITQGTEQKGYFFTPEQLNQLLSDVIKDTLKTGAKEAEITNKPKFNGDYNPVVDDESITNTFEETFNKFKV